MVMLAPHCLFFIFILLRAERSPLRGIIRYKPTLITTRYNRAVAGKFQSSQFNKKIDFLSSLYTVILFELASLTIESPTSI